jgi:predicted nuclease of predicted toxin-antitoxin system
LNIKLDENIVAAAKDVLIEKGYAAHSVPDQHMNGWSDDRIWRAIQKEGRFLITQDKGFGDVRRYPPGSHHGILLLRPGTAFPKGIVDFIEQVLDTVSLEELDRCVTVATANGIRIRRPPKSDQK